MEDSRASARLPLRGVVAASSPRKRCRAARRSSARASETGEQVRWGIEHLNIDDKRLKELAPVGLMQSLRSPHGP